MAKRLEIPRDALVTIEHPGIVKHTDKAISSLGGHERLDEFLSSRKQNKELYLYTRPEDRFRRPIPARQVATSNLVLRIDVPKLTGRKRKRGSDGPFEAHPQGPAIPDKGTATLLRSLKDNPKNYRIEVEGETKKTCKFLGLPDLQWSLASHPIAKGIKCGFPPMETAFTPGNFHMLPGFFPNMDTPHRLAPFDLDPSLKGNRPDMEIAPPPGFMQDDIPFDYQYSQAINTRTVLDEDGNISIQNKSVVPRSYGYLLDPRVREIPTKPRPTLGPEESLPTYERDILRQLRKLYDKHPIYTRRKLLNMLDDTSGASFRNALQYVAYLFKAGPWKDCYIKLGVDPRTDPKYRVYQSLAVRLPNQKVVYKAKRKSDKKIFRERRSHVFDGKSVELDNNHWALIDISEPLLKKLITNAIPRTTCETRDNGWIQNCTLAKIRTVLRHKIVAICAERKLSNRIFSRILELPETMSVDQLGMPELNDVTPESPDYDVVNSFKAYIKQDSRFVKTKYEPMIPQELSSGLGGDEDRTMEEYTDDDMIESDDDEEDELDSDLGD